VVSYRGGDGQNAIHQGSGHQRREQQGQHSFECSSGRTGVAPLYLPKAAP
jgi:hypothetical protein